MTSLGRLTIGKQLSAAFLLIVIVNALAGVANWFQIRSFDASVDYALSRARILRLTDRAMGAMIDQETGLRGLLISGDEKFLEPLRSGEAALALNVTELRKEWATSPDQLQRLDTFLEHGTKWRRDIADRQIELMKTPATRDQAREIEISGVGKASMDGMRAKLKEMQDVARQRYQQALLAKSDAITMTQWILVASAVGIMVLAVVCGIVLSLRLSSPVRRMTDFMTALAGGDSAREVPSRGRGDEIGAMAGAVQVFKDNLIRTRALEAETAEARLAAEEQRKAGMRQMADAFEQAVGGIVGIVSSSATELQATAQSMTATATETAAQSTTVAAAAEEAAANVGTVAAAAEELGASVSEIGRQVQGSANLAQLAVSEAAQTGVLVEALAEAAQRIGDVVGLISTIAGQTNLLALNATIEAARAGEAGRGFAVVAAEVKELASQTAKATDEITSQIGCIQDSTGQAVAAIKDIRGRIQEISGVATSIAAAVEEQGAATQEIVRNVSQAATGTSEVTTNIAGVAQASEETGAAASQVLSSASELSRQSEKLAGEVHRFLDTVRAA